MYLWHLQLTWDGSSEPGTKENLPPFSWPMGCACWIYTTVLVLHYPNLKGFFDCPSAWVCVSPAPSFSFLNVNIVYQKEQWIGGHIHTWISLGSVTLLSRSWFSSAMKRRDWTKKCPSSSSNNPITWAPSSAFYSSPLSSQRFMSKPLYLHRVGLYPNFWPPAAT